MLYSKAFIYFFFCSLCIVIIKAQTNGDESLVNELIKQLMIEVDEKLQKQEDLVKYIAMEAKKLYKNREREISECTCSHHTCSTNFSEELKCYEKLRLNGFCQNYAQEKIDPTRLGVRLPPGTDPTNLSDRLKSSICTFQNLDKAIVNNLTLYDDIWTYVGISTGLFVKWPLIPDERCEENGELHMHNCISYDCRTRPWYVGAVSGPKDIVIMIDRSGSMASKWRITIDSAIKLLKSLTFADYISVILFSNENINALINDDDLIQFDSLIEKELTEELENELSEGHNTNFKLGFEKAFDLLVNGKDKPNSENRAKMIVVISDGDHGEANSDVLEYVQERQKDLNEIFNETVIIHSLLIDTGSLETSLMKQLSCQNTGISLLLENEDNLLNELITGFLSFNALTSNRTTPIWIEIYEDFSRLGNVTTVALPIFSDDHWLIGVVGKSIRLEYLTDSDGILSYNDILETLLNKSYEIKNSQVIKPCELQVLRNAGNGICPTLIKSSQITCYKYEENWYKVEYDKLNWNEARDACILNNGDLASIVNEEELKFISSISHPDGTWLGAKYDEIKGKYLWIDEEMSRKDIFFGAWTNGKEPEGSGEHTCVVIDPRGITNNLYVQVCDKTKLTFVCIYKSEITQPAICINSDIFDYNIEKTNFTGNPPLEQCREDETNYNRSSFETDDVSQVTSAICPMGAYMNWDDVACCPNDDIINRLEWWEILLWTLSALFCMLFLIYLLLVFLDYSRVIDLEPCFLCNKLKRLCCGLPVLD